MSKCKSIPIFSTKSEMRKQFLNEWAKPICDKALLEIPELNCCIVAVGQYYNDEANDAVHAKIFPSLKPFSSFEDLFNQDLYKDDYYNYNNKIFQKVNSIIENFNNSSYLRENSTMIYAFEEYCELSFQDESYSKRYFPYALIDRNSCDIIGKKLKNRNEITISYDDLFLALNDLIFTPDDKKIKIGYSEFKVKNSLIEKEDILYSFIKKIMEK